MFCAGSIDDIDAVDAGDAAHKEADGHSARANSVVGNTISNNTLSTAHASYGITIGFSLNNRVFHNSFTNNMFQVNWVSVQTSVTVWDNGYTSGGNYWSDYAGFDANGDGIGDTPYVIDEKNQDRYPLMKPYAPLPSTYMLGDLNLDGRVDITDLAVVARAFGSSPTRSRWNPKADINQDGIVDIADVALVAQQFGQHYP